MLATFASLILLVQHISTMLQAPNIAAAAGAELRDVVLAEIPDEVRSGEALKGRFETIPDSLVQTDGYAVRVRETGYIQYIDPETLFKLAREKNLVIRLLHKPGHFVQRNMVVALVWPAGPRQEKAGLRPIDEELEGEIRQAFEIGSVRTPTQDVAYAVNQLVEMAVRAMSAAINDPFTAMTCLDYIGEGLGLFIRQGVKDTLYYDREGRLCLIFEPVTFDELLDGAFDMLRHASCDNASVLQHMLEVIDAVGQEAGSPVARQALLRHVSLIQADSQAGALIEQDRQLIQRRVEELITKLA
jgi:uncharacterized membrane protein